MTGKKPRTQNALPSLPPFWRRLSCLPSFAVWAPPSRWGAVPGSWPSAAAAAPLYQSERSSSVHQPMEKIWGLSNSITLHSEWFIRANVKVESRVAPNFCLKFIRLGSHVAPIL